MCARVGLLVNYCDAVFLEIKFQKVNEISEISKNIYSHYTVFLAIS